jgi:hypothetical protein
MISAGMLCGPPCSNKIQACEILSLTGFEDHLLDRIGGLWPHLRAAAASPCWTVSITSRRLPVGTGAFSRSQLQHRLAIGLLELSLVLILEVQGLDPKGALQPLLTLLDLFLDL